MIVTIMIGRKRRFSNRSGDISKYVIVNINSVYARNGLLQPKINRAERSLTFTS